MTHRAYLSGIAGIALIALSCLTVVTLRMDPFTSSALSVPLFFGSLFLSIATLAALAQFYGRVYLSGTVFYHTITIALRQGILLAIAVCSLLALQVFRVLTLWDALLIILAIFLIELYFLSHD